VARLIAPGLTASDRPRVGFAMRTEKNRQPIRDSPDTPA
jgi:hypothetical protein